MGLLSVRLADGPHCSVRITNCNYFEDISDKLDLHKVETLAWFLKSSWKLRECSRIQFGSMTKPRSTQWVLDLQIKWPWTWNPCYKIIIIIIIFLFISNTYNHNYIMKTKPSYKFQHHLLTREVFIIHTRYQDILILKNSHKKSQIAKPSHNLSYQLISMHLIISTNIVI